MRVTVKDRPDIISKQIIIDVELAELIDRDVEHLVRAAINLLFEAASRSNPKAARQMMAQLQPAIKIVDQNAVCCPHDCAKIQKIECEVEP